MGIRGERFNQDWLRIGEAADCLGVHVNTLRRWADDGSLPYMTTAGGHRRFRAEDLEQFLRTRTQRLPVVQGQEWAQQALYLTRERLDRHREDEWMAVYDEQKRREKRLLGRRLLGVLLQYISGSEEQPVLLQEARRIGQEHARQALQQGAPMADVLQAAMFFRDSMLEAALALPYQHTALARDSMRLFRRINTVLNVVQLAVAEVFQESAV